MENIEAPLAGEVDAPINAMARVSNKDLKNDRESMSASFFAASEVEQCDPRFASPAPTRRFRVRTMAHLQKNIIPARKETQSRLDIFPRW
jgi:hypothetical protein